MWKVKKMENEYPYVSLVINEYARNMLIKTTNVIYTDEDHFHFKTDFDLANIRPHPEEDNRALNIFGEAMLNDYLNYHYTPQRY